jgi:hypothetical protein
MIARVPAEDIDYESEAASGFIADR